MATCPYCGGDVEQRQGEVVLTCPYCGTAFAVDGGDVGEHLMGRVNYDLRQVFDTFKIWALRIPETPNDFYDKANLKNFELVFYPYWVYEITGYFNTQTGAEKSAVEVSVPSHAMMRGTPLEKAKLSLSGKVFYSHRYVVQRGGRIVNPSLSPREADNTAISLAEEIVARRLSSRLGLSLSARLEKIETMKRRLIHEPVYHCLYEYDGRNYRFMSDASDSRVLYAEIPVELKFRAAALAGAIASFAAGVTTLTVGLALEMSLFAFTSLAGLALIGFYCLFKALLSKTTVRRFFAS